MLWLLSLLAFAVLTAAVATTVEMCFTAQPRSNIAALLGLLLLLLAPLLGPLPTHLMRAAGYSGPRVGLLIGGALAYVAGGVGYWILHRNGVPDALAQRVFERHAKD